MKQSFELTSYISKVPMGKSPKRVGESVEVGINEANEAVPSESDLRTWYKATGAVPPFAGAVPSYKLLKKMFLRDKKQKNKAWEIWQDLVKKGTVSESVEVTEAAYNTIQVHPAYRDDDKGWYITHTDAKGGNQVWGPFASITEAKKAARKYAERYGATMKEESEVGIEHGF